MRKYVCQKCGARVEAAARPTACRLCGGSGPKAFAEGGTGKGASPSPPVNSDSSVENLFDLGPPKRKKQAAAPIVGSHPAAKLRERSTPGLTSENTLELDEKDIQESAEATGPEGDPSASAEYQLDDQDLLDEVTAPDLKPAKPPAAPPVSDTAITAERAVPRAVASHRSMRGRVAIPITDRDDTPAPSTLPSEVNELAVAGEPPVPIRRGVPLRGQNERLVAIQERKRRRQLLYWAAGGFALVTLVAGGYLTARALRSSSGNALSSERNDAGGSRSAPEPDSRALAHAPTTPTVAGPLASPLDAGSSGDLPRSTTAARTEPSAKPQDALRATPKDALRPRPGAGGTTAARPRSTAPGSPKTDAPAARPEPAAGAPVKTSRAEVPKPTPPQDPAANSAEARARYREGLQLLLRGDHAGAVRLFNEVLTMEPRFSLAYRGLGLAYEKAGSSAMARAAFSRYLMLQPAADDVEAIRQRIESLK